MSKADARQILENQIVLLSEKSKECTDIKELTTLTKLMYELYARIY